MARKLNVPSVTGLNVEGIPFGMIVFLQEVQNSLNTIDNNVVYKDDVSVNIGQPKLRSMRAQGQAFSISGVNAASGEDYITLVSDVRAILEDLNALRAEVSQLKTQIKGS